MFCWYKHNVILPFFNQSERKTRTNQRWCFLPLNPIIDNAVAQQWLDVFRLSCKHGKLYMQEAAISTHLYIVTSHGNTCEWVLAPRSSCWHCSGFRPPPQSQHGDIEELSAYFVCSSNYQSTWLIFALFCNCAVKSAGNSFVFMDLSVGARTGQEYPASQCGKTMWTMWERSGAKTDNFSCTCLLHDWTSVDQPINRVDSY
jgi:hypothetical protein